MRVSFCLIVLLALPCVLRLRADWPDYRGPWRDGHVSAPGDTKPVGLPIKWSERENVRWKTAIPHRGWSTPVILGGQIWLTTATTNGQDFFAICVDAASGKTLLSEKLFHCDTPEPLGNDVNCYAAPSVALETGRAYVHFGSYGTACMDTKTFQVIWKREDLPCRHYRGPGSSPILHKDLLVLTMDGIDLQYLVALDKHTGKTVWKTDRSAEWNDLDKDGKPDRGGDLRKAFSTPIVIEAGGVTQLISSGSKASYAYDPATGRELWRVNTAAHSPATRPLFDHGLVFVATGSGKSEYLAVRPDGRGNVSDAHVVWRTVRGAPRLVSPVLVDGLVFLLGEGGVMRCVEAANGNEVWQERVAGECYASPIFGDGHIYCSDLNGKTTVLKAGRSFEVVATNTLDDGFMASPAVLGKALVLRTKTHLYRIESDPATAAAPAK